MRSGWVSLNLFQPLLGGERRGGQIAGLLSRRRSASGWRCHRRHKGFSTFHFSFAQPLGRGSQAQPRPESTPNCLVYFVKMLLSHTGALGEGSASAKFRARRLG